MTPAMRSPSMTMLGPGGWILAALGVTALLAAAWARGSILAPALLILGLLALFFAFLRLRKAGAGAEPSDHPAAAEHAEGTGDVSAPGGEREELRRKLESALGLLRSGQFGGAKTAVSALPWYLMIGPPSSGKTSMLSRSGIRFFSPSGSRTSKESEGATSSCEWWLADDGVILDTAGRYAVPATEGDRQGWRDLLDLVGDARKGTPINGLIIAVSAP